MADGATARSPTWVHVMRPAGRVPVTVLYLMTVSLRKRALLSCCSRPEWFHVKNDEVDRQFVSLVISTDTSICLSAPCVVDVMIVTIPAVRLFFSPQV